MATASAPSSPVREKGIQGKGTLKADLAIYSTLATITLIAVGILTHNPLLIAGGATTGALSSVFLGYQAFQFMKKEKHKKDEC